jgi:hypothetical protein
VTGSVLCANEMNEQDPRLDLDRSLTWSRTGCGPILLRQPLVRPLQVKLLDSPCS